MSFLLDSSAIAIILKKLKENAVEYLEGKTTLDFSRYELGNVIWKEYTLKGLISREEALNEAEDLAKILKLLNIRKIESDKDFKDTMKLATELKLTFYDASYLQIAKTKELPLVTEDKKLSEKAAKAKIKTITVDELLKK